MLENTAESPKECAGFYPLSIATSALPHSVPSWGCGNMGRREGGNSAEVLAGEEVKDPPGFVWGVE